MGFNALVVEFVLNLVSAFLAAIFGSNSFLGSTDVASVITAFLTQGP